jgi:Ion transport protein
MSIKPNSFVKANRVHPVYHNRPKSLWKRTRVKFLAINAFLSIYYELKRYKARKFVTELPESPEIVPLASLSQFDRKFSLENWIDKGILMPESKVIIGWDILILLSLTYTATILPFVIAFYEKPQHDALYKLETTIDIIFLIDIIVSFNLAYYNSNNIIVVNRKEIAWKYIKSWLCIDILSCIPFSYFTRSNLSLTIGNNLLKILKMPKPAKALYVLRLIKIGKFTKKANCIEKILISLKIKYSSLRLLKSMIFLLIALHIVSCYWCYLGGIYNREYDSWIYNLGVIDTDVGSLYITGLYWAVTTLCTVGYGDIHAYNTTEMLFSMFWMGFGLYFVCFVIGSLSSMLSNVDTIQKQLDTKLAILDEFAHENKLDKNIRKRIKHALNYSTGKGGFTWSHKFNIFNELPKNLKYEVAIAMHGGAARKIPFFIGKDPVILLAIVPFLLPLFTNADENVYNKGEYSEEIFFIVSGKVNYIYTDTDCIKRDLDRCADNSVLSASRSGDYFGEIEVVKECERIYSTKTATDTEMLIMNRLVIINIQTEYPRIWAKFETTAFEKEILNEKALVEILELKRLKNGLLTNEEYDKNLKQRLKNNKIFSKIKNKSLKSPKSKINAEFLLETLKKLQENLQSLNQEVTELKSSYNIK